MNDKSTLPAIAETAIIPAESPAPVKRKRGAPKGFKPPGRKKGVPNKTTKAVKEALVRTYVNIGGNRALAKWARENPTEFYKIWAKLLPSEINANVNGDIDTQITVVQRFITERVPDEPDSREY